MDSRNASGMLSWLASRRQPGEAACRLKVPLCHIVVLERCPDAQATTMMLPLVGESLL